VDRKITYKTQFSRFNQPIMCDADGMERSVEFSPPKVEKFMQSRKLWCQIVFLPNKRLQQILSVWHSVQNFGCGQAVTAKLRAKLPVGPAPVLMRVVHFGLLIPRRFSPSEATTRSALAEKPATASQRPSNNPVDLW
jgi:hypothetical protein